MKQKWENPRLVEMDVENTNSPSNFDWPHPYICNKCQKHYTNEEMLLLPANGNNSYCNNTINGEECRGILFRLDISTPSS